jgi:hypothetical protein
MGATMMPTFSGAIQTLRRASIARATTTLNINQQVSASIGTAVLSVILAGHLDGAARTPAGAADAFGMTFIVAAGLVVVALVVATLLLPRVKPDPPVEDDAPALVDRESEELVPVLA